jgi:hypothetical protein
MQNLDFAAMENIQGGSAGTININLPLSGLLGALSMGGLLGVGLGLGLSIGYNIEGLDIPSIGSLTGLTGLL